MAAETLLSCESMIKRKFGRDSRTREPHSGRVAKSVIKLLAY